MKLHELINLVSWLAEDTWRERGQITATWYAETRDGRHLTIPFPDEFGKHEGANLVRRLLVAIDAARVVFVDECFYMQAETPEQMAAIDRWYETHDGLEDFPGRREAVALSGEDESGEMLSGHREILRQGQQSALGPLRIERPRETEGAMVGWLPVRGTKQ
jgi:hypothetical protein